MTSRESESDRTNEEEGRLHKDHKIQKEWQVSQYVPKGGEGEGGRARESERKVGGEVRDTRGMTCVREGEERGSPITPNDPASRASRVPELTCRRGRGGGEGGIGGGGGGNEELGRERRRPDLMS